MGNLCHIICCHFFFFFPFFLSFLCFTIQVFFFFFVAKQKIKTKASSNNNHSLHSKIITIIITIIHFMVFLTLSLKLIYFTTPLNYSIRFKIYFSQILSLTLHKLPITKSKCFFKLFKNK